MHYVFLSMSFYFADIFGASRNVLIRLIIRFAGMIADLSKAQVDWEGL